MDDFDIQMREMLQTKYAGVAQDIMPEGYLEAPLAYDAIWAIALGKSNLLFCFQFIIKPDTIVYFGNETNVDFCRASWGWGGGHRGLFLSKQCIN